MLTPQHVPARAADLYQQTTKIGWHFVDTRGYPTWQARAHASAPLQRYTLQGSLAVCVVAATAAWQHVPTGRRSS